MDKPHWSYKEEKIIKQFNTKQIYYLEICIENNFYWKMMLTDILDCAKIQKIKIGEKKNEQTSKYAIVHRCVHKRYSTLNK